MADDKQKFQPTMIKFKRARLAFARIHKAEAKKGRDGKVRAGAKEKFSCTILLDPSRKDHAETISEIKAESVRALNHRYGEGKFSVASLENHNFQNFYLAWGLGNDLPKQGKKIYDGFADMFYLKLSDENRPNLLNRAGTSVVEGDKQCPYAGCYVAGTTTLYSYDNESRGVNANLRTLVFMEDGAAFGGSSSNAEEEYAALGDLGNEVTPGATGTGKDPFEL